MASRIKLTKKNHKILDEHFRMSVNQKKEFQPIPKGWVIYHLDGNKDNDDVDNLEAISRAELMQRNRKDRVKTLK